MTTSRVDVDQPRTGKVARIILRHDGFDVELWHTRGNDGLGYSVADDYIVTKHFSLADPADPTIGDEEDTLRLAYQWGVEETGSADRVIPDDEQTDRYMTVFELA